MYTYALRCLHIDAYTYSLRFMHLDTDTDLPDRPCQKRWVPVETCNNQMLALSCTRFHFTKGMCVPKARTLTNMDSILRN